MSTTVFDAFTLPGRIGLVGGDAPATGSLADRDAAEVGADGPTDRGPAVDLRGIVATPEWIDRLAEALLASREALVARPAMDVLTALGRVGRRFLDDGDPLRTEALALLPPTTGLSPEMCRAVLDGMAADWTEERLRRLLEIELGGAEVLDGFVPVEGRNCMALGPSLCVQIVAGSVPGVGTSALIRSLLLKGPTLLKPGRGDVVLPVLFARALGESDPELAESLAVVYWPGGARELDEAALGRADVVTVYGSDETVAALRAVCPPTTRFVGYHHRVSVGVLGRDALGAATLEETAAEVAESVALFDQRGCVSPQLIFVEEGAAPAEHVARVVAGQLARLEERLPSGPLEPPDASGLHQLRGSAELLAAAGKAVVVHGGGAPWTVILEEGDATLGGCAGRTLTLRAVQDAEDVPELLAPLGPHLQTVGVTGLGERTERIAGALGRAGASRVVPFPSVPFPPPWWHHDGRGPLRDLVRWVDLERS